MDPSHYFDDIELFIQSHPDSAPLAVLRKAVRDAGCPEDQIDSVVNGAIVDVIGGLILPKEPKVSVINPDGEECIWDEKTYTYDELLNYLENRFPDLGLDRAKAIVDYMIRRGAVEVDSVSRKMYRTMSLMIRVAVDLG